jgi:hypothetical protein
MFGFLNITPHDSTPDVCCQGFDQLVCFSELLTSTLSLLMPRYLAQPFNVIKWQLKYNPAA